MLVSTADHSNQPIFPEYSSPTQWPWTIAIVINEARRILGFFELPESMRPPKQIWHSPDKCNAWINKAMNAGSEPTQMLEFSDTEFES